MQLQLIKHIDCLIYPNSLPITTCSRVINWWETRGGGEWGGQTTATIVIISITVVTVYQGSTHNIPHFSQHTWDVPIVSPISHRGDLRLREMKLFVQATQPAPGKKNSNPVCLTTELGYYNFYFATRHGVALPFYNETAKAWGQYQVWGHYITLSPLGCVPDLGQRSAQDFCTTLSSVPKTRERKASDVCRTGRRQPGR